MGIKNAVTLGTIAALAYCTAGCRWVPFWKETYRIYHDDGRFTRPAGGIVQLEPKFYYIQKNGKVVRSQSRTDLEKSLHADLTKINRGKYTKDNRKELLKDKDFSVYFMLKSDRYTAQVHQELRRIEAKLEEEEKKRILKRRYEKQNPKWRSIFRYLKKVEEQSKPVAQIRR